MQEGFMGETTTITVRLPVETKAKLDRLAELTERSRSYLASEALDIFVRQELLIVEGVLEGLADVKAGRVFTSAEVQAEMEQVIAEAGTSSVQSKKRAAGR
jgi:predicted transcriptional regulator